MTTTDFAAAVAAQDARIASIVDSTHTTALIVKTARRVNADALPSYGDPTRTEAATALAVLGWDRAALNRKLS